MKFLTLDGKEVRLEIKPSRYPRRSAKDCKSTGQYHLGCRVADVYPAAVILEEFTIPGSRLRIDFYLPTLDLAFEFQGEQHDRFNKFFHGNRKGFEASLSRDKQKKAWCELNGIKLIYVESLVTNEELKELIVGE